MYFLLKMPYFSIIQEHRGRVLNSLGATGKTHGFTTQSHGFTTQNRGFSTENDGFRSNNDGFRTKNDGFCIKTAGLNAPYSIYHRAVDLYLSWMLIVLMQQRHSKRKVSENTYARFWRFRFYAENHEFCPKTDGAYTKNDNFCTKNDGFCTKNAVFWKVTILLYSTWRTRGLQAVSFYIEFRKTFFK